MKRKEPEHGGGEQVPIWVISFADMITLLLSFFVMLQTMAHTRESTLMRVGQDSFRRALAGMGIPDWLFGRQQGPELDFRKIKYPTEEAEEGQTPSRVIDPEGDRIRKLFDDLQRSMKTDASQAPRQPVEVFPTSVRFEAKSAELSADAQRVLARAAVELRHRQQGRLYVIGLAGDESGRGDAWATSARRAAAAQAYLAQQLQGWDLYSWGAGADAPWCQANKIDPGQTYIVLVTAGASN
jgi:chemotaxis protein MotB